MFLSKVISASFIILPLVIYHVFTAVKVLNFPNVEEIVKKSVSTKALLIAVTVFNELLLVLICLFHSVTLDIRVLFM